MRVVIDPKKVIEFVEMDKPALVTVHALGIFFNRKAVIDLNLIPGYRFLLVFEDGIFYLEEAKADAACFRLNTELKGGFLATSPKINKLIETYLKKGKKSYQFRIEEFKLGRRVLTLI